MLAFHAERGTSAHFSIHPLPPTARSTLCVECRHRRSAAMGPFSDRVETKKARGNSRGPHRFRIPSVAVAARWPIAHWSIPAWSIPAEPFPSPAARPAVARTAVALRAIAKSARATFAVPAGSAFAVHSGPTISAWAKLHHHPAWRGRTSPGVIPAPGIV